MEHCTAANVVRMSFVTQPMILNGHIYIGALEHRPVRSQS